MNILFFACLFLFSLSSFFSPSFSLSLPSFHIRILNYFHVSERDRRRTLWIGRTKQKKRKKKKNNRHNKDEEPIERQNIIKAIPEIPLIAIYQLAQIIVAHNIYQLSTQHIPYQLAYHILYYHIPYPTLPYLLRNQAISIMPFAFDFETSKTMEN